ncbi:MAG: hypothetical protein ACRDE7_13540, partial [Sphingobacterium sp.]
LPLGSYYGGEKPTKIKIISIQNTYSLRYNSSTLDLIVAGEDNLFTLYYKGVEISTYPFTFDFENLTIIESNLTHLYRSLNIGDLTLEQTGTSNGSLFFDLPLNLYNKHVASGNALNLSVIKEIVISFSIIDEFNNESPVATCTRRIIG